MCRDRAVRCRSKLAVVPLARVQGVLAYATAHRGVVEQVEDGRAATTCLQANEGGSEEHRKDEANVYRST